ncbi:ketopantoate reductase [Lachnospiraceae bacterium KM106-2]|nr:ketopantoate reductase [Lachnospiraceae bacterium KM106-2]
MRILVYGAGVIGCELAHELGNGRNDVTLLARGAWKQMIDSEGLKIRHKFQLHSTLDHIKTIESLKPEDNYDIIFVAMQYSQLQQILPTLGNNKSKRIILVGNNMNGDACEKMIMENSTEEKEIAFAFQSSCGRREEHRLVSIHVAYKLTIGALHGQISDSLGQALEAAFEGTKCEITLEAFMDGWLKSHMVFIMPFCYLCYALGGKLSKASNDDIYALMDATIEAHEMLKALEIPIRPDGEEEYFTKDRKGCYKRMKLLCKTFIGKMAICDHAMSAINEMKALDLEIEKLRTKSGADMGVWEELRERAGIFNEE